MLGQGFSRSADPCKRVRPHYGSTKYAERALPVETTEKPIVFSLENFEIN